jgi:ribosomal protein S27AE
MSSSEGIRVVVLRCQSCGASLSIAPDMDVLACAHCGTEQVVRREGGTISLKVLEKSIAAVMANTDRIASELAITRLRHDLADVDGQITDIDDEISDINSEIQELKGGSRKNRRRESDLPKPLDTTEAKIIAFIPISIVFGVFPTLALQAHCCVSGGLVFLACAITFTVISGVAAWRRLSRLMREREQLQQKQEDLRQRRTAILAEMRPHKKALGLLGGE